MPEPAQPPTERQPLGRKATEGYPVLAQLMGPHAGLAMFKHFAELNAHSLLLQQAELLHLQAALKAQQARDEREGNAVYNKDVRALITARKGKKHVEQWQLHLEI